MQHGIKKTGLNLAVWVLAAILSTGTAAQQSSVPDRLQRYIVVFHDLALAGYDGRGLEGGGIHSQAERLEATSPAITGSRKLDVRSPQSQAYLNYLDETHAAFRLDAAVLLGRTLEPTHVYRSALNGMAMDLTPSEAEALAESRWVKSINKDTRHRLETDAGPEWIGADDIWIGSGSIPSSKGEGVVIGVIDSGINWDHPSFSDPGNDGHNHVNPFGSQLGLCSDPDVMCNNKVVGIYDFVEDDPGTTEFEEENTKGKDNSGHGSHVAGIAAGNTLNVTLNGSVSTQLSGVAPHANLVIYRVCFIGEPPDPEGGGCQGSAILSAIDQAVSDGVDVINYSIGTDAFNPWSIGSIPMAYLNARNAGIFVVTSAGNDGPNPLTVGSPADAPWIMAAGNASHNRIFGSVVQNLSGGSTAPPDDLVGASLTGGLASRKIVHAKDYGFALCGTGQAELQATCQANLGQSNPWSGSTPFNGEIVVCDRGTYGRIEKGKNVMLAGAGGFILANTNDQGESLDSDEHCLPASHIGDADGDQLRAWLNSGSNHMGSISGFTLAMDDKFADVINSSSSRGPMKSPVQNTLKPNVIAPGSSILSASDVDQGFAILSGTSMSSPHVAGAGALLLGVNPGWTVAQVSSAIQTTAVAALAKDTDGSVASPHERGSGRPQLGNAANAGLYLNVTGQQFSAANPQSGGNPQTLNLAGLVSTACKGSCSFNRTVTDQMGGGSWAATGVNFPAGVQVTVSPSNFTLSNGASQALSITVNVANSGIVGQWVYGDIRLTAPGSSNQALTVAVYSSGGDLPSQWEITDQRDTGWKEFNLSGLANMPDATFTSGGLVRPTRTTQVIKQDPTATDPQAEKGRLIRPQNEDPFDGGEGTFTVWHNLPQGGLWLHAETLTSTAADLDLFVGRDDNQDGLTDAEEQLCESTSADDLENCDLFNLPAGNYWVVVQNWDGTVTNGDEATLISAAVDGSGNSALVASGPGIVAANASFKVRTSWSNVYAPPGEEWYGAVGIGTNRENPNNVGVIPVLFNRSGVAAPQTLPLMNGSTHKVALAANGIHDRMFVDIPPDVTSLNVTASGASSNQSNALKIELFRQDFGTALASPPFVQLPGGLTAVATATGSGGNGPSVTLNSPVTQGRYYVKLTNTSGSAVSVSIQANISSGTASLNPQHGLWDFTRGIAQGAEWNSLGNFNFTVWYAYDDDGQPTWYIASAAAQAGNVWTADLLRVTNDGGKQQESKVGKVSITFYQANRMIFSYTVQGQSGFDIMKPNGPNTCPNIGGGPKSYTGHWYRGVDGLGGSTVLVYDGAQAQVHYFYDAYGVPRWALAADDANQSATAEEIPLLQFSGFCATCTPVATSFDTIGMVERTFSSETSGSWTLDFVLDAPLNQNINRTDSVQKLSDTLNCN